MRTRLIALVLMLGLSLIACSSTPQTGSQVGIWDQSNFETTTWN